MIANFAAFVCALVIVAPAIALFAFRKQPLLPRIAIASASPVVVFIAALLYRRHRWSNPSGNCQRQASNARQNNKFSGLD
jgi:hypothetical protein